MAISVVAWPLVDCLPILVLFILTPLSCSIIQPPSLQGHSLPKSWKQWFRLRCWWCCFLMCPDEKCCRIRFAPRSYSGRISIGAFCFLCLHRDTALSPLGRWLYPLPWLAPLF